MGDEDDRGRSVEQQRLLAERDEQPEPDGYRGHRAGDEEQQPERVGPPARLSAQRQRSPSAGDERQQAGDESSDEAGVDSVARRALSRVPIVLPGGACRQYAIPLLGEARQNDHDERRDEDHSENQRG